MCFIPDKPSLYLVFTNMSFLTITMRHVIAFLLIVFASFVRRRSLSGYASWSQAHRPIGPSLNSSPAPITTAQVAIRGLVTWWFGWIILILLVPIIIDLLVLHGTLVCANVNHIINYLTEGFTDLGMIAKKLVIAIAS